MNAADFAALVRDLRAAGLRFEPDVSYPFLVRQQAALFVAIGQLCRVIEKPRDFQEYWTAGRLRQRCYPALRWIEAMGKRSIWGTKYGWFRRCS